MSVDTDTVRRVARLARIKLREGEADKLTGELNAILGFVEELGAVDVEGVEPMTSVVAADLQRREDAVTDGGRQDAVLANAPESSDGFFLVPRVVE